MAVQYYTLDFLGQSKPRPEQGDGQVGTLPDVEVVPTEAPVPELIPVLEEIRIEPAIVVPTEPLEAVTASVEATTSAPQTPESSSVEVEEPVGGDDEQADVRTKRGRFPFYRQRDEMDCGPTCLRMIFRHYGKTYPLPFIREKCHITNAGVSLLGMAHAAESLGMRTLAVRLPLSKLREVPLPCIAHWRQNHFVVIHKVTRTHVFVADPAYGLIRYTWAEFERAWAHSEREGELAGVLLLMEPTPSFGKTDADSPKEQGWGFLWSYVRPYRRYLTQLGLGMLAGGLLGLLMPLASQALVDQGIQLRNLSFVMVMIIAQLVLFVGQLGIGFIERWLLLHIGVRLNLALLTDFLIKMTRLPLSFFERRTMGDLLQRMSDHGRVEQFLTTNTLSVVFSLFNVLVFGAALAYYNVNVFLLFLLGAILSAIWLLLFMRKRRELDFKAFAENARTQNQLVQIIEGYPDVKLARAERQLRWNWEHIQIRLFRLSARGLALEQVQSLGLLAIQQLIQIVISYWTAKAVIDGQLTLGGLVAVQYLVGQVSAPLNQLVGFIHVAQDARLAVERIGEIYQMPDEQPDDQQRLHQIPAGGDIVLDQVSYRYGAPGTPAALENLNLHIPAGKTTAIVGTSGSGKTTLLKLLLRLYEPTGGRVLIGSVGLNHVDVQAWRKWCGAVMQDGYIFGDTLAGNIALGEESPDMERLYWAAYMANLLPVVEQLPDGLQTKVGMDGRKLSQGQQQRVLLARALYGNPAYLFLDEATSALDAENEAVIVRNLASIREGRTLVVIAHRLSTVRNADQIVVLDQGRIVESGTHTQLIVRRGAYFHLIRNQLELGE